MHGLLHECHINIATGHVVVDGLGELPDKFAVERTEAGRPWSGGIRFAEGGIGRNFSRAQPERQRLRQTAPCLQQIPYAGDKQPGTERFGDIGVGTDVVALLTVGKGILGRKQYHGDMACSHIALYVMAELDTVLMRHHYVADNQIRQTPPRHNDPLAAIGCLNHIAERRERCADIGADLLVVLHDKHEWPDVAVGYIFRAECVGPGSVLGIFSRMERLGICGVDLQPEMEYRSLTRRAFH